VRTKDVKNGKAILSELTPVEVTLVGNAINFKRLGEYSFKKVVPFAVLHQKIVITLPANITLKRTDEDTFVYRVINSVASARMRETGNESCYGQDLKYSEAESAFVCDNPQAMSEAQHNKFENLVRSSFRRLAKDSLSASGVAIPPDSNMNSLDA